MQTGPVWLECPQHMCDCPLLSPPSPCQGAHSQTAEGGSLYSEASRKGRGDPEERRRVRDPGLCVCVFVRVCMCVVGAQAWV